MADLDPSAVHLQAAVPPKAEIAEVGDIRITGTGIFGTGLTVTGGSTFAGNIVCTGVPGVQANSFVSALTGGGRISQGSGAPSKPVGNPVAGDIYFRTDTPNVANQNIYICTVGGATPTWVGLV